MKAVILAAGMGTRLRPETDHVPKAMVKVLGKSIIDYQIEALRDSGVTEIIVVTGYLGHVLEAFLKKYVRQGLTIRFAHNEDYASSSSAYSFWLASPLLGDSDYIHLNCDIVFRKELLKRIVASAHQNVIALDQDIALRDNMEQVALKADRIIKMDNVFFPEAVGKAVGVARFSGELARWMTWRIARHVAGGDKHQNYFGVLHEGVHHHPVHTLPARGAVREVNSLDDLGQCEAHMRANKWPEAS